MIGQLRGIILAKQPPQLLVDVQGVGYEVDAPMSTFYHLPDVGKEVVLHTHFVVREDAQLLYGFLTLAERSLFRTLLKVNGVGPKLALTILSGIDAQEFIRCVMDNDTAGLVRLPGVGKKTAERLIIEMRDKVTHFSDSNVAVLTSSAAHTGSARNAAQQDAVSALIALGYKPQEASRAVAKVKDNTELTSEELIRCALQEMV